MRSADPRLQITPSVLDRLLDDDPKHSLDEQSPRYADISGLKRAVARDLEALLNCRSIDIDDEFESYPQVRNSSLTFGFADLSSLSLLDPGDRAYLRDKIRMTVESHEPRLGRVRVSLDAPSGTDRLLHFRVDAILKVLPSRPPVCFDAMLQLSSNACQIKES